MIDWSTGFPRVLRDGFVYRPQTATLEGFDPAGYYKLEPGDPWEGTAATYRYVGGGSPGEYTSPWGVQGDNPFRRPTFGELQAAGLGDIANPSGAFWTRVAPAANFNYSAYVADPSHLVEQVGALVDFAGYEDMVRSLAAGGGLTPALATAVQGAAEAAARNNEASTFDQLADMVVNPVTIGTLLLAPPLAAEIGTVAAGATVGAVGGAASGGDLESVIKGAALGAAGGAAVEAIGTAAPEVMQTAAETFTPAAPEVSITQPIVEPFGGFDAAAIVEASNAGTLIPAVTARVAAPIAEVTLAQPIPEPFGGFDAGAIAQASEAGTLIAPAPAAVEPAVAVEPYGGFDAGAIAQASEAGTLIAPAPAAVEPAVAVEPYGGFDAGAVTQASEAGTLVPSAGVPAGQDYTPGDASGGATVEPYGGFDAAAVVAESESGRLVSGLDVFNAQPALRFESEPYGGFDSEAVAVESDAGTLLAASSVDSGALVYGGMDSGAIMQASESGALLPSAPLATSTASPSIIQGGFLSGAAGVLAGAAKTLLVAAIGKKRAPQQKDLDVQQQAPAFELDPVKVLFVAGLAALLLVKGNR